MRVLVLHAYSAANLGDGLLVEETLRLINEAFGKGVDVTVAASHPQTFQTLGVTVVNSAPGLSGYDRQFLKVLANRNRYDLIVGVGGGYLRAGTLIETLKTALVHGPQLLASSVSKAPVVYLSQSIGPARYGLRRLLESRLRRLDLVMLRDDRSMDEFPGCGGVRTPDLATTDVRPPDPSQAVSEVPVLSVRAVRKRVPEGLHELARIIGTFDSYVQSTSSGNDDRPATSTFRFRHSLSKMDLLRPDQGERRVVVAVRLHAALMALQAGHFVIHLAYERKGFGAFSDLGLDRYVHNVNRFSPEVIAAEVQSLLTDPSARAGYSAMIESTEGARFAAKRKWIAALRETVHVL